MSLDLFETVRVDSLLVADATYRQAAKEYSISLPLPKFAPVCMHSRESLGNTGMASRLSIKDEERIHYSSPPYHPPISYLV
jgi:hypothetical protein